MVVANRGTQGKARQPGKQETFRACTARNGRRKVSDGACYARLRTDRDLDEGADYEGRFFISDIFIL